MLGSSLLTAPGRSLVWWLLRSDRGHGWTSGVISAIAMWVERSRSRRALAALDDDHLRDVAISRADARHESAKPFWRA